jgi:hypothetical protein
MNLFSMMEGIIMALIDDLKSDVAAQTTVEQSVLVLLANIADEIEMVAGLNQLQSFAAALKANGPAIAAAVLANTSKP